MTKNPELSDYKYKQLMHAKNATEPDSFYRPNNSGEPRL